MKTERICFDNGRGQQLAASVSLPASGAPESWALFAHCFTCGKDLRAAREVAGALAGHGIATLRFDVTGLGASEGAFVDETFTSNTDDLVAAAAWLEREHAAPQLLVGHSLGGAAVLYAAERIPSARAVATIGSPCDPAHVGQMLAGARAEIEAQGSAEVLLAGRPFPISRAFLEALEAGPTRLGAQGPPQARAPSSSQRANAASISPGSAAKRAFSAGTSSARSR